MSNVIISGIEKNSPFEKIEESIKTVFLQSTNNLPWLKKGDRVLLKPALNSPDPYPATTHPLAIKVIKDLLEKRGANVIIGDQSGIANVLQNKNKIIYGSSADNFVKSGMGKLSDEFTAFEKGNWEKDFIKFKSDQTKSWNDGFYVTKWVDRVDHIVNLPRISAHVMAGITLGFKNWVGILRQDSRVEFHADGPLSKAILFRAKLNHLKSDFQNINRFVEKIVEISLAVKSKLRITLFVGTKAQVTIGPDSHVGPVKSKVIEPKTGLIIASTNPVAAEVVALSYLTYLYQELSLIQKIPQKILLKLNPQIKELGSQSVWENPFIKHALKLKLGNDKIVIKSNNVAHGLIKQLKINVDK